MRDLYSDDYESVAGDGADRLIPDGRPTGSPARRSSSACRGDGPLVLPARHPRRGRGADHQGDGGPGPRRAGGSGRPPGGAPGARGQRGARRAAGADAARRRAGRGRRRRRWRPRTRRRASWCWRRRRRWPSGCSARTASCRCRRRTDRTISRALVDDAAPGAEVAATDAADERRCRGRRPAAGPAAAQPAGEPRGGARQGGGRSRRKPAAADGSKPAAPAPAAGRGDAGGARGGSGSRPGTRLVQLGAFDSEEITRQAWASSWRATGDLLGVEEPLRRADHRQRPGVLPAAGGGLPERRPDAGSCARRCGRAASPASR